MYQRCVRQARRRRVIPATAEPLEVRRLFAGALLSQITSDLGGTEIAAASAMQRDGSVVVLYGNDNGNSLARYTRTGALDSTFNGNGHLIIPFTDFPGATRVGFDRAGKILIAGHGNPSMGLISRFAVARFNPDGTVDTTFGTGGETLVPMTGPIDVNAVAVDPQGNIVVVGDVDTEVGPHVVASSFATLRLLPNGAPDPGFGSGGTLTLNFANRSYASAVAFDRRGRMIVAGSQNNGVLFNTPDSSLAMARLNRDGSLDPTFGSGGQQTFLPGENTVLSGVALANGGNSILVSGTTTTDGARNQTSVVARFHKNGALDLTFGRGHTGYSIDDFGLPSQITSGIIVAPGGKFYVGGYVAGGLGAEDNRFLIARYSKAGLPDPSFGSAGVIATKVAPGDFTYEHVVGIGFQPGGTLLLVGNAGSDTVNEDLILASYSPTLRIRKRGRLGL